MRTAPGHLIGSRSRGSGQRVVLVLAGTTPFAPDNNNNSNNTEGNHIS